MENGTSEGTIVGTPEATPGAIHYKAAGAWLEHMLKKLLQVFLKELLKELHMQLLEYFHDGFDIKLLEEFLKILMESYRINFQKKSRRKLKFLEDEILEKILEGFS